MMVPLRTAVGRAPRRPVADSNLITLIYLDVVELLHNPRQCVWRRCDRGVMVVHRSDAHAFRASKAGRPRCGDFEANEENTVGTPIEGPDLTFTALQCDRCGYDLRGHGPDGRCPECGGSVAESRLLAAIPRRPVWGDSDPRWRRRMLAGAWILVLVPLGAVIASSGWASGVAVPTPFDFKGALMLHDTFAFEFHMYEYVTFCIGVVLLFSNERNRRRGRSDWTRRWGVTTSYGVFLLGIPKFANITALVVLGIAALFQSMPLRYQPGVTELLVKLGAGYIYYGPHEGRLAIASLLVFSSVVVMLACAPLYNALHSSGPKALAALLLAPLLIASMVQLSDVARYGLGNLSFHTWENYYPFYFNPELLVHGFPYPSFRFIVEAAKWSACLTIAMWLSIAQIMAWWRHGIVVPPIRLLAPL